jgi:hypothetical protein
MSVPTTITLVAFDHVEFPGLSLEVLKSSKLIKNLVKGTLFKNNDKVYLLSEYATSDYVVKLLHYLNCNQKALVGESMQSLAFLCALADYMIMPETVDVFTTHWAQSIEACATPNDIRRQCHMSSEPSASHIENVYREIGMNK